MLLRIRWYWGVRDTLLLASKINWELHFSNINASVGVFPIVKMNFRDSIWIRGMQFLALRVTLKFISPDFELVYVKSVMRCFFLQCTWRQTFPVTARITFYLHRQSHDFKQWFQPLCRRGKLARKCSLHLLFVPMFAHTFNLRLADAYISIHLLLLILLFELAPRASGLCWASVLIFKGPFSSSHSKI